MINLPASNLSTKWSKEDLENSRIMKPFFKYEEFLAKAHQAKKDLLFIRKKIKAGIKEEKQLKAAIELESSFKADAINYWEKSQEYLNKYNELKKRYGKL